MRHPARLAILLTLPALLLAADLFGSLGLNQKEFEDSCFQFVKEPERLPNFRITPAMRALAVIQRKAAAESIGAKAKAYYASEAFKKRWAEHRAPFTSREEEQAQKAKYAGQNAQAMDQSIQQMEQMLPMVPPAKQAQMKKAIEKAKADRAKKDAKASSVEPTTTNAPPKDPAVNLKKALQHFLKVTDGVDYAAATLARENRRYFANQDYEHKSDVWKMAFRAGKDTSEGVRAYVRQWIAELK